VLSRDEKMVVITRYGFAEIVELKVAVGGEEQGMLCSMRASRDMMDSQMYEGLPKTNDFRPL
jgi:hypothetical protein